ncbi:MAG: MarR family transcriptional regulator [Rhizobiaceae bacterium]|nr:MarR family transcriptional regulator [Rhizobiaceae bacterium]
MKDDVTENLGFLIHTAARLLRRRFEARGAHHGLSAAQWRLLVHVVKSEGIAQARLAELLEIEPISVSRLVDRMEEAGWIERRQDATDRRVRMIFPTERSREVFGEVKSMAGEVYDDALRDLSREDRRALVRGLDAIVRNLSDEQVSAGQEATAKGHAA